jgi:hypothetical protein
VVDVLKITSPVSIKSKVQNLPSKLPTDAVFDITNPNQARTEPLPETRGTAGESGKQSLLKNLNKEIFEPLLHSTRAQADGVRKLVLMARLFEAPSGILSESFLDRIFVRPQDMLAELLTREKGATAFTGEFFDSLRMLAKLEGQPRLKEAVVSILKYFDCHVNQENSLKAIVKQGQDLGRRLPKGEAQTLRQQVETLETMVKLAVKARQGYAAQPGARPDKTDATSLNSMIKQDRESQSEIKAWLKNEIIPELGRIAKRHQGSEKIYNQVMAIVHNIVRYDKADPRLLEEAVFQLGDDLKRLTNLTDADILEMKQLVFEDALKQQEPAGSRDAGKSAAERFGPGAEETDMASLLSKALDKSGSSRLGAIAQSLLLNLVQSESPLIPLMHFTIPFRYQDENTYGEFFVDKDCKERRGDANSAKNIFFTIQSDQYGNFEVDLLARDKRIDLDIRCPDGLLVPVRETRGRLKEIIEAQGYRLAGYEVGVYQESRTIMQRFPKLAMRKVGIDVKV